MSWRSNSSSTPRPGTRKAPSPPARPRSRPRRPAGRRCARPRTRPRHGSPARRRGRVLLRHLREDRRRSSSGPRRSPTRRRARPARRRRGARATPPPPPRPRRRDQVPLSTAPPAPAAAPARRRARQLRTHRLVVASAGRPPRRQLDQVDQHPAALDVGEELVPEPGPPRGALDQPGNVGDHQLPVLAVDRPQHRRERRERIVGDLRRRPGQPSPAATTCRRSAAPPGRRRRAASAAARSSPTRRSSPSRRTAAPGGWRSRSACSRARRPPGPPPRAARARPGRSGCPRRPSPAVPGGTGITRSSPRAPCLFALAVPPLPAEVPLPFSAARSRRDGSQTSTTSPPCPPSPPSGPPRGTWASRRKLTQPLPPPPPSTQIFALSYTESRGVEAWAVLGRGTRPQSDASRRGRLPAAMPAREADAPQAKIPQLVRGGRPAPSSTG